MPQKQRYHIHICLVRNEDVELQNALQYALSTDYFMTWDLIESHAKFSEYSRQQIDECDYLLFILDNDYGHLSPSGVSYLHLNYIYAVTKRVPMIALVRRQSAHHVFSRQRLDLANLIVKDQAERAVCFQHITDAVTNAVQAMATLVATTPKLGWVKNRAAIRHAADVNHKLHTPRLTISADKATINSHADDNTLANLPIKVPIDTIVSQSQSLNPRLISVEATVLAEPILVNYSAHAYEGGNLAEFMATHTFSWGEIIKLLNDLPQPFSSDMMLRRLNDSLKNSAIIEASKVSPNIHAVSRCQINPADYQWLKTQLIKQHWIVSAKDTLSMREMWRLNVAV